MENEISTKDLDSLNHLMIFQNWAYTKFKMFEEMTDDAKLKTMFKGIYSKHEKLFNGLYEHLESKSQAGGKK